LRRDISGLASAESCRFVLSNEFDGLDRIVDAADQNIRQLNHLALRNLGLRDDRKLADALDSGQASAPQLGGTEPGEDDEMKRSDAWRALNHNDPVDAPGAAGANSNGGGDTKSTVMDPHDKALVRARADEP
jgi:hypothetical protein